MMTRSKMKAYHVQADDSAVVEFSNTGVAARRQGANELGIDFEDVVFCERMPWADIYADQGYVPISELIDKGWWFECSGCGQRVSAESTDYNDNPHELFYIDRHVYHSATCYAEELAENKAHQEKQNALASKLLDLYPGVEVSHVEIRSLYPSRVFFTFSGGTRLVEWREGEDTVLISKTDVPAWLKFKKHMKKEK